MESGFDNGIAKCAYGITTYRALRFLVARTMIVREITHGSRSVNMLHRHLTHQQFTLAAIDDIISRGRWRDWADLRQTALGDPLLLEKVQRVCRPHLIDPYAQRYHFWMHYAEEHRAAS